MRVNRIVFAVSICLASAIDASAAFSFVQTQKNFDNGHAGSVTVTLNSPYSVGSNLMVAIGIFAPSAETVSGVTAAGATFSSLKVSNTDSGSDAEIWCGHVASGGATAITVNVSGTLYAFVAATVVELSGGAGCSAESTNSNTATSSTVTTGSAAATGSDLIFAAAIGSQNINSGPTNSFTSATTSSALVGAAYQIEGGSGSYSTGWGLSSSAGWNAAIVAINPTPPLSASPTTIPSGHGANITLTLTGAGTSWSGGTTFAATGVPGVLKVSQNVTSSTAATMVVTTGSGTGTLAISDGSHSTSIQVSAPSLSMTLQVPNTASTTALTFTGINTLWTHETASTLFSAGGGLGAAISGVSVSSDTAATATLTVGNVPGIVTITDNSVSTSVTDSINSNVGPKTEAYIESTFLAGVQDLVMIQAVDGLNWTNFTKPFPTISGVRDPTFMDTGGVTVMAYNDVTQGDISTITLWAGTSFSNMTFSQYIPIYSGQPAWAPKFFLDSATPGTLYMTVSTPSAGYGVSILSAPLPSLTPWTSPTIILPFSTTGYDGTLYTVNGQYYLFYVIPGQGLYYATSSVINGTFSGANLVVGGNYESPVMTYSPITGYRLYFTQASGDNGGFYVPCTLSGSTFAANGMPTRFYLNGSTQTQHGTVIDYGPVVGASSAGIAP